MRMCITLAHSGASSKDFTGMAEYKTLTGEEGGDPTIPKLGEADTEDKYLIIGFGHNDQKQEAARYTNPNYTDYKTDTDSFAYSLYENYIKPALEKDVTPVVVTPIVRLTETNTTESYNGSSGHITSTSGSYAGGNYAEAIRKLCAEDDLKDDVILVDLTAATLDLNVSLGEGAQWMHAFTGGKWTNKEDHDEGITAKGLDKTHTNSYGAKMNAWLIGDLTKDTALNKHWRNKKKPSYDADFEAAINESYTPTNYTAPTKQQMENSMWDTFTDANGQEWYGTVFGEVGGASKISKDNFHVTIDGNTSIELAVADENSTSGFGKIDSTADGYFFYYTRLPADTIFELSATAKVNRFYANGQVSYGLMARDDIYIDTYEGGTMGDYVVAGTYKQGTINCFGRKNSALYNGPTIKDDAKKYVTAGDTVELKITSNSDGFAMNYGANDPVSAGFDYLLTSEDDEYIYVGFYVTRNADISFSDISLTIKE